MKPRPRNRYIAHFAPLYIFSGRSASLFFLVVASFLILLSFARPSVVEGMRLSAMDTFLPVLAFVGQPFHAAAEFVGGVSGISELRAENARLQSENIRLRDWYQKALMLQSENQSLQELLNLKIDQNQKFVTTRVVADSGTSYVHSVIVAAGKKDSVKKGQAVLAGEGMIGRIIESGQKSARVLLLTDFNSRIPVLIEGSRQKAVLAGNNDSLPILKHLPPDGEIEEGMRIVTSGHGGLFPAGLPIGKIVKKAGDGYVVRPFADINKVSYVRIIDLPMDPNLRRGTLDTNQ